MSSSAFDYLACDVASRLKLGKRDMADKVGLATSNSVSAKSYGVTKIDLNSVGQVFTRLSSSTIVFRSTVSPSAAESSRSNHKIAMAIRSRCQ